MFGLWFRDSDSIHLPGYGVPQLAKRVQAGENTVFITALAILTPIPRWVLVLGWLGTRGLVPVLGLGDLESHSKPLGGSETFRISLLPSLRPQTPPALPTASPPSVCLTYFLPCPKHWKCELLTAQCGLWASCCSLALPGPVSWSSVHSLALPGPGTYFTVRFLIVVFFHQQFCTISTSCHRQIHHIKSKEVTPASPKLFISIIPLQSEVQTGDYLFSLLTSLRLLKVWMCW